MDWPQYMTLEQLLAAKEGRFGTLSIVARMSSNELSSTRVNLASVGLVPGDGAGHAAIVHEFEGHVHAFFTTPEHPYSLGFSDRVPGDGQLVIRTRELLEPAAEQLNAAMFNVLNRQDDGVALWTPLRTSAAFAASIWESTFGETLTHRMFGMSSPDNLGRSILEVDHREREFRRGERPVLDLTISERISDLMREQQTEESSLDRGLSI